jgi:hypothetical protein
MDSETSGFGNVEETEEARQEREAREKQRNKQQVVKDAWLGKFVDRDGIHTAASAAAARMRVKLFERVSDEWIWPYTLKEKKTGKSYKLWVIAHLEGKRDYMAPVADTRFAAIADRADTDGWNPQGHEADFRVFEPITLEGRVLSGGPFIYGTREEAQEALAELIFEGASITLSKGREGGTLTESVRAWTEYLYSRIKERSHRYEDVEDDLY